MRYFDKGLCASLAIEGVHTYLWYLTSPQYSCSPSSGLCVSPTPPQELFAKHLFQRCSDVSIPAFYNCLKSHLDLVVLT